MRKIFVDLGAHTGESVEAFYNRQMIKDIRGYLIFCFEPLFILVVWDWLMRKYPITLIPKAAWLYDGEVPFGIHQNVISSTIIKEKIDLVIYGRQRIKNRINESSK